MSMIFPRNHEEAVSAPKDADAPMVYVQSRGNRDERPLYTGAQLEDMGYAMVIDAVLAICVNFHFTRMVLQELKRSGNYGGLTRRNGSPRARVSRTSSGSRTTSHRTRDGRKDSRE